jgi:hypothetical protein
MQKMLCSRKSHILKSQNKHENMQAQLSLMNPAMTLSEVLAKQRNHQNWFSKSSDISANT